MTLPFSAVKVEKIRSASTGPPAAEISKQSQIAPGNKLPSSGKGKKIIFSCAKMPETLNDAAVKMSIVCGLCVVP